MRYGNDFTLERQRSQTKRLRELEAWARKRDERLKQR